MPDSMNTPNWPAFEAARPRPALAGRAPGGGVDREAVTLRDILRERPPRG